MNHKMQISLSKPDITEKEIQAVLSVLKTQYLSLGPKLVEFEEKFAAYVGTRFAIAVNSGTSGLHLAVKSLGIGHGDAVITTPFSFIASANCLLYENAQPIFVDIEPRTFNINPKEIMEFIEEECDQCQNTGRPIHRRTSRIIKAILPVHVFGHPCAIDELLEIVNKYNLYIIEDACEAIGAKFRGRKIGTFGHASVFAFYPNKQMTTGEGGMIVTDDEDIAVLCKSLRNQGRDRDGGWLGHERLGYNYRLSDINCALGIAQLERIDKILERRKRVALIYNKLLSDHVQIPITLEGASRSWFVYVVCLPFIFSGTERDGILSELAEIGISCSNYFPPIHLQPFVRRELGYRRGDFAVCEAVSSRTLALPFSNNLSEKEIKHVAENLIKIIERYRGSYKDKSFYLRVA